MSSLSALSFTGLASGLDTNKIVDTILGTQKKQIDGLKSRQSQISLQQTAFQGIQAKLISLLSAAGNLGKSVNNSFDGKSATSSNTSLLTAAASSTAQPGVYSFKINSLAKNHQLASQGFASTTSTIGTGTFALKVGAGATKTITIDGSNNTLQGLATAINGSGAGVTATIVNDGSGSTTQPYRLFLTANDTGAANTITVTNGLVGVSPEFNAAYIGVANKDINFTGTSTPTSNTGSGGFTGTANNSYTFTVTSGGTVGTDTITLAYSDTSGANSGTITVNPADVDVFKTVAQGIQVKFNAGALNTNDKFTVDGFVPNVQAAADASLTFGSGAGALTVTSAGNKVDGVVPGVTLNLVGADGSQTVTLTIASDTATASKAVNDFVSAYNDVVKYINERSQFNTETNSGGVFLRSADASLIELQLSRTAVSVVDGVNGSMNRLSALGIKTQDDGTLTVDQTKLADALAGNISGVSYNDVRRLFALDGASTNSGIKFLLGSDKTVGSATPYGVDIVAAAEQAKVTAGGALAASTTITAGTNDAFTITVNGTTSGTIKLAPGTYTRTALAQEVQNAINADTQLAGNPVSASVDGSNRLVITTEKYGSAAKVTIGTGGNALGTLGFAGGETDTGLDVVGQFIVGGVPEPGTGIGRFLSGNISNANTAGLQVEVTLTPAQVGPGSEGNLTVSRGIASRLAVLVNKLQDPNTGRLKSIDDAFKDDIDVIKESIDRQTKALDARRAALLKQFSAMELTISRLKTAGAFLTAQLGSANLLSSLMQQTKSK